MNWKRKTTRNRNPYLSEVDHGTKSERRVVTGLGGRLTPASGALPYEKSDGVLDTDTEYSFRLEAKATIHASMSVRLDWLRKIAKEARDTNRIPALTVSFVTKKGDPVRNGDWVMIPLSVFNEVFGNADKD